MNDVIFAINKTIEQVPQRLVEEVNQNCGRFNIYLDGDNDDYEFFMETLGENLPCDWEFENNLMSRGRCHIGVHRVKSVNTLRHYFKIVSSEFEEEADGYVENGKVVYKDPLWDVYWADEYPFQGELKDCLERHDFDETLWVQGFSLNEFGIYSFEKFSFIVNPRGVYEINEALLSTLIHFGDSHKDSLNRGSVQDLLDEVFLRRWFRYIKTSPIMGVFHHESGRVLRVHFGDSEIADAVESAICRMEIDFVDKNPVREE